MILQISMDFETVFVEIQDNINTTEVKEEPGKEPQAGNNYR